MEYDTLREEVVTSHSQMQLVMDQNGNMQFLQTDVKMTKSIFVNTDDIGFKVVGCVSDYGGGMWTV